MCEVLEHALSSTPHIDRVFVPSPSHLAALPYLFEEIEWLISISHSLFLLHMKIEHDRGRKIDSVHPPRGEHVYFSFVLSQLPIFVYLLFFFSNKLRPICTFVYLADGALAVTAMRILSIHSFLPLQTDFSSLCNNKRRRTGCPQYTSSFPSVLISPPRPLCPYSLPLLPCV